jgi:hypothetical protein
LRSELYHQSLYYTYCVRCGNRFLLLFIADNLSNITLYWWLGENHYTRFSYFHISSMSIMQIWTFREEEKIVQHINWGFTTKEGQFNGHLLIHILISIWFIHAFIYENVGDNELGEVIQTKCMYIKRESESE